MTGPLDDLRSRHPGVEGGRERRVPEVVRAGRQRCGRLRWAQADLADRLQRRDRPELAGAGPALPATGLGALLALLSTRSVEERIAITW
ncbi:hypothetical protein GCM10023199_29930 [Actinomycetospora chibensis]